MNIRQIRECVWEIPKEGAMNVNARVYVNKKMLDELVKELRSGQSALKQLKNVASLPGLKMHALALADCHPGYGAPIGGVAASDLEKGVITFGLIGFDINCGVRTMLTPLKKNDIAGKEEKIAEALFKRIPAGLGSEGEIRLRASDIDEVLVKGAEYAIKAGYGFKEDLEYIELNGKVENAKPECVSERAKERERNQLGTLGSGNHYLEVQYVSEIFDENIAEAFGLFKEQIVISVHCGSRGLGHQIGMDYIRILSEATRKYGIKIPDRQLVSAPIKSIEGERYLGAVNAGINFAFANRQVIGALTRSVFANTIGLDEKEVKLLFDVGHNTAKIENHEIEGSMQAVLVQRKGSTRGFAAGRKEVPEKYRKFGQPVIVGGTMGTASYILVGTELAMQECFGSAIHGAGRVMGRGEAKRRFRGSELINNLRMKGIIVKAHSLAGAAEEAPQAYKDIHEVVNTMEKAGVSKKVAMLKPIITVKG